jgi:dolichol-phosphate mannosyltransferase
LDTAATQASSAIPSGTTDLNKVALIIPTLRESQNVRILLPQLRAVMARVCQSFEIIVVDDDSRDGTEELVRAIAAEDARVRLVVRRGERGLSGAILHGWQQTDAGILGVMDADLQHPPELLPKLFEAMVNGCDLAIGSRYAPGGCLKAWYPTRKAISAIAVWMTYPLQKDGLRVKDPMSGFLMVRRRCVERVLFQSSGFKLLLEILTRGRVCSVREIPFEFGKRRAGRSKAGFKVAWAYLQLLGRLYWARLTETPVPLGIPTDESAEKSAG